MRSLTDIFDIGVKCAPDDRHREMRPPSDSKSPRPVSQRGLKSCDAGDLPDVSIVGDETDPRADERLNRIAKALTD